MRGTLLVVSCFATATLGCASASKKSAETCRQENIACQNSLAGLQVDNSNCSKALAEQNQRLAFLNQWQAAFAKISGNIRSRLAQIEVDTANSNSKDEDVREIVTESVEFKESVRGGALVLAFSNDVFFSSGKPVLTPKGKRVAGEIARALQESEKRPVYVICRSIEAKGANAKTRQKTNAELSSKRAAAIVAELAGNGCEVRDFVAGAYGNSLENDAQDSGVTELAIQPLQQEALQYPSQF